ncbi:MAG: hypothetical protein KY475_25310 [Planctomycetes bacterium]|nr:hypothetical protein [Planctomycetota bacterium]
MLIPLHEFVISPAARVDREAGVIRDVKVLGYASANGRRYSPEAVRRAVALYEGIRVNVDHPPPARAEAERPVAARFGVLKGVAAREDGLYGDLHYLRSHPLAELTAEAAERLPEALGLSHNAEGRVSQNGGVTVVEEIVRVRSVDLVADPATTRSLFEGESVGDSLRESPLVTRGASDPHWRRMLEAAGVRADDVIVEALACLPDDAKRQDLIESLSAISRGPSFSPRPRSCEPFWATRPVAFPADAAGFVKALR